MAPEALVVNVIAANVAPRYSDAREFRLNVDPG